VRSFEAEEERLLKKLGVRVYRMHEVEKRGLAVVMAEALQRVQSGTAGFGLTVDLDAVDPRDAPAVTTPVAHGLRAAELIEAVASAARQRHLVGVEIAEYNPHNDCESRTAELIQTLIETVVAAEYVLDHSVELEQRYCARNYAPLPVVLTRGRGVYVWDAAGKRYLDMMAAYSAVSLGHAHPQLISALTEQAGRLSLVSRAYFTDRLGPLAQRLCELTGFARMLPMNTGAEAVETALKAARKWAYKIKRVPDGRAQIISCAGNFHGRTIAIVSMSSEAQYRDGFGPFPPGFVQIPYGDSAALEQAITPHTAAFLIEPIQGESGIVLPPTGYLAECARICKERNVLLLCDEVQTGLGRTGQWLACQHEKVQPDGVMVGKALSGGLVPISAFLASEEVMSVFTPGDHGSTFGGNPLACAVALETLNVLQHEHLVERSAEHGAYLLQKLMEMQCPFVCDIRGKGLFIGVELDTLLVDTRAVCEVLLRHGILTKDTHETVLRFAPPLTITRAQLDEAIALIAHAFDEIESHRPRARRVS
jgi:ornithine--oxo-acid transaminase